MSFRPPGNTVRLRVTRFRQFDGIGGPRYQILQRRNEKGWDISTSVANEVTDLNLAQPGTMQLREGCRKVDSTGKTASFHSLFMIGIGRDKRYAVHYGSVLDVIDIPEWYEFPQAPFDFVPAATVSTATNVYPASDPGMPL